MKRREPFLEASSVSKEGVKIYTHLRGVVFAVIDAEIL
jgi:hypothetical protein